MIVPTVKVRDGDGYMVINTADYDKKTHGKILRRISPSVRRRPNRQKEKPHGIVDDLNADLDKQTRGW